MTINLTPDQIAILDKIRGVLDEVRKDFDIAVALGLGSVPGVPIAQIVFDQVDNLWDYADGLARGDLTALQAAVKAARASAQADLDATFPAGDK